MRLNFLLCVFLTLCAITYSQTKISGKVVDVEGQALPYVNVVFEGTHIGTITNENGRFYLESEEAQSTVSYSFIGFETQLQTLTKPTTYEIVVVLKEAAASLDEVLVVGGKQSKKNNPAIDILRKIWEKRKENGLKKFNTYTYDKYEKQEFDLNTIDSNLTKRKVFKGLEFVFEEVDTSKITGNTYLPIFINESVSKVYGDNQKNKEKEILKGNKNSGFENNQTLIAFVKDIYKEYNIYDNYLKFFDKAFTSPLSRTGISVYNYVLIDSAYRDNKWCYNVVFYPRRKNELTFKGDFWVNDTTWAIKEINLHASKSANLNWVREVYIEQEFEVLNDSLFLLKRDHFMSDFSFRKKESARGVYGKRTTLYENYEFNKPIPDSVFQNQTSAYPFEVYNRPDSFWETNRMEPLNKDEKGIYKLLDTLKTVPRFKAFYNIGAAMASGYYEVGNIDVGPLFSIFGFNEAEGYRIRLGGRTYFGQNDPWRLEVFGAYGFRDQRFKYGVSGKLLVDKKSRFILFGGNRRDVEQTGASLTQSNDVLGRNLASSSLITVGANDKLTRLNLFTLGWQVEPFKNLVFRNTASYRKLTSATETFSLNYRDGLGQIQNSIKQPELDFSLTYTPQRKRSGFGVEQTIINDGEYATVFASYTLGLKNVLGGDFAYQKVQGLYTQPWNLGGLGRLYTTVELGKIFGDVPLGLLSPIPGNQTLFSIYNTFSQLDFYEFVSDTYASFHMQHNFGGRIFSRVPLLRDLNLREVIGLRGVVGSLSQSNIALNLDLQGNPILYNAPTQGYWEWSVGVGNIFKIFRLDFNFRGNLKEAPNARNFGITGEFGFSF